MDGIIEDVRWLGADWGDRLCFASDYFEQMYEWAVDLIRKGKAFVCDLSAEEVSAHARHAHQPGHGQPLPEPERGGEPGPLRPHAGGRVPGRRPDAAREDRHGVAEHACCATR